jgi:hypothetical protein
MFSFSKVQGPLLPGSPDWIKFESNYVTDKKPVGTVLLRTAGLLALLALATAFITPPLLYVLPAWKAVLVMLGMVLVYLGVSFIVRPQVDRDTLDWRPGSMTTEPAANINRLLAIAHWLLAPGRFAAETLLDICVLTGLAQGTNTGGDASGEESAIGNSQRHSTYSRAAH